jgi:hypothetical protein
MPSVCHALPFSRQPPSLVTMQAWWARVPPHPVDDAVSIRVVVLWCLQVLLAGSNKTNVDLLNKCDITKIGGGFDNLYFSNANLFIAEDTRMHLNNVLWAYNTDTGQRGLCDWPTGPDSCQRARLIVHTSLLPAGSTMGWARLILPQTSVLHGSAGSTVHQCLWPRLVG